MWCGAGYLVLLGVLAWLFQSWPGGFWGWLGIAWSWLRETPGGYESASTTIRNLGLFVAAPFVLWFAYWRAKVADRQSKTAQRSLLNEQYQKGAEMLGSEVLSVRLGGIYTLARLACEHPEEYHVQIMRLFCAFVLNPTIEDGEDAGSTNRHTHQGPEKLRPDIQEIMTAIGNRSDAQIEIESQEQPFIFCLDLRGAALIDVNLDGAKLTNTFLYDVNLTRAILIRANLTGANLDGAVLQDANLTGANLSNVSSLTQHQLDTARADRNSPPKLDGALDVESFAPLVWNRGRGEPPPESAWMLRSKHQKSEEETTN